MNHEIKDPVEFSYGVRKFENTDKASADVLNEPMNVLVNNDAYLNYHLMNLNSYYRSLNNRVTEVSSVAYNAKIYTDEQIEALVDGAPYGYDTLGKIVDWTLHLDTNTNNLIKSQQNEIDKLFMNKLDKKDVVGENLLPFPYFDGNKTYAGITYTANGDGTVTASGKSTGSFYIFRSRNIADTTPLMLPAGTYVVSGCPSGGGLSTYYLQLSKNASDGSNYIIANDYGEGMTFTLTEETQIQLGIVVNANCPQISNLVFKPMLEKGSVAHEYQPYNISRKGIIEQIVVDNLIDSNFTYGWIRTGTYSYESGKATFKKGANATSSNSYHCKDYYLEKGKAYTVSAKVNSIFVGGGWIQAMYVFDTDPVTYETINVVRGTDTIVNTFTVAKDCKYVRLQFSFNEGGTNGFATEDTEITFSEMMLEEGMIAHTYQPYNLSRKGLVEQIVADNLILYPYSDTTLTINGITFVDNGDGTVTVNGTATATTAFTLMDCSELTNGEIYTLSGCPKGGAVSKYRIYMSWSDFSDIGDGYTGKFVKDTTNGNYLRLQIANGVTVNNLTFKPMLEKGAMAHPYQPYNFSREKIVEQIMADNLIEYPYKQPYNKANGITWSKNDESGVVIANGTATAHAQYYFNQETTLGMKPNETYTLSGFPKGQPYNNGFRLRIILNYNEEGVAQYSDFGAGVTFTTPSNFKHCRIMVDLPSGTSVSILVIKPMLEKGNVVHPYTEYRKSHTKLREDLDTLMEDTGWVTLAEAGAYSEFTVDEAIRYRVIGNKLYIAGTVSFSGGESSLGVMANLGTLPSDIVIPHSIEKAFAHSISSTVISVFSVQINTNRMVALWMAKNTTNSSASLYKKYFEECILLD